MSIYQGQKGASIQVTGRRIIRSAFIENACRGKQVLDIGCLGGAGIIAKHVREVAESYTGVDIQDAPGVIRADAQEIYLNRSFDLIVAGEIIEHLPNPQGLIESCIRHLEPGGRLIITTPNAFSFLNLVQAVIRNQVPNDGGHLMLFDATTFTQILEHVGRMRLVGELHYYEEAEPSLLTYRVNKIVSKVRCSWSIGLMADLRAALP
jgi:SAM-dependent methyltransferase